MSLDSIRQISKIINTSQSRSVIVTGNVGDLFYNSSDYVPLITLMNEALVAKPTSTSKGITQIFYQINRPIKIMDSTHEIELNEIWKKTHLDNKTLSDRLIESNENSVYAFEILRQITECARKSSYKNNILVVIEAADFHFPESEISRMNFSDRKKIGIIQDWLSDPEFMNGHDSVILISESRNSIHHKISRMPSVLSVDIPLPNLDDRKNFIKFFSEKRKVEINIEETAIQSSGLSIHAIRQLICSGNFSSENIAKKVEEYMVSQLGEGVVEFKRPKHTMNDILGNKLLKKFLIEELIPDFRRSGKDSISGVAVGGPIGAGKTYICEAVASELGIPVLVLKNIRSKWFGETDEIFERLRRLLETFHKIVIFVDEADTMFGDIQSDQDTERRLTGKIQNMMSDPILKGRVIWFLMTARIHKLSPDIRRPGRMDLILPVLDPEGDDRLAFLEWSIGKIEGEDLNGSQFDSLIKLTKHYSAASFSLLKSSIKKNGVKNYDDVVAIIEDIISPDIEDVREYQTLQAKLNCTRKSLLSHRGDSDSFRETREKWKSRILFLENQGIT